MEFKKMAGPRVVKKPAHEAFASKPDIDHLHPDSSPETSGTGVQGLLSGIFEQLESAQAEAANRVEKLKAELATAERDASAIDVLLQIRKGTYSPNATVTPRFKAPKAAGAKAGGTRGGARGETAKAVQSLLEEAGADGLLPSELFEKLQADDSTKQSVRNYLAASKKGGKLVQHSDKRYALVS